MASRPSALLLCVCTLGCAAAPLPRGANISVGDVLTAAAPLLPGGTFWRMHAPTSGSDGGLWVGQLTWQSANTIETLANLALAHRPRNGTLVAQVRSVIAQAYTLTGGLPTDDEKYDDMGWWALAWARCFALTGNRTYLDRAETLFDVISRGGWSDSPCGGGAVWGPADAYKNAITNELLLAQAATLATLVEAQHPGGGHSSRAEQQRTRTAAYYTGWARKVWSWFNASGLIGQQGATAGLVNDGLTVVTANATGGGGGGQCANNRDVCWTYNQGVALGGLGALAAGGGAASAARDASALLGAAAALANATTRAGSPLSPGGVLRESCEDRGCDQDQQIFKGIFVRHAWYLCAALDKAAAAAPGAGGAAAAAAAAAAALRAYVGANARSAWTLGRGIGGLSGINWSGNNCAPHQEGSTRAGEAIPIDFCRSASTQSAVLDLMIAAAWPVAPPAPPAPKRFVAVHSTLSLLSVSSSASAGDVFANACTDGGTGGCAPPQGAKWDRWDMAGSTYTYCFHGCPVPWLLNNTKPLGLGAFAGVVGVDHYYTKQGTPCVGGEPVEFAHQAALSASWKAVFPALRFMTYRILSAVPYDMAIKNQMDAHPEFFVRWLHQPGSAAAGNGSICYNYKDSCFNDFTPGHGRINDPSHNCSFAIRSAAYNWANPAVGPWFLDAVVKPAIEGTGAYADGVWLDGIGPDNGAYMCSGVCCGFGPDNSPHNAAEIAAQCAGMKAASTAVEKYLTEHEAFEVQKCFEYTKGTDLPNAKDSAAQCAAKLQKWAAVGADHAKYNAIVAYGSRTGGTDGYDDSSAAGTVAAFMLMRGAHWFLSITNGDSMAPATARLLTSDHGRPLGNMTAVSGRANVFQRVYEKATVTLDCGSFEGTFTLTGAGQV